MPSLSTERDSDAMLQLKLEAPRQPTSIINRPRLIATLKALLMARLLLLVAPAGYGKTTLLAQWRSALIDLGNKVAWITLDDSDSDPRQFLVGLVHALQAAGLDMSKMSGPAERGLVELTIEAALRGLMSAIEAADSSVVVMLDDYDRASNPALDELLARLLGVMPEQMMLIVSSRLRPDIDVPRLLAAGTAAEMSCDSLRFTTNESRQLLEADLPGADLDMLIEHTEGWPVALQLARLALRGQNISTALSRLTARGGHLSKFLTDQVLKSLTPDVVDFLIETSILEKFNVEITDYVRGRTDSWRILESLEALQSLLTPLDAEHVWFRYHHLFAEYLQTILRQRRPGAVAGLHLRASEAFERAGLLSEAVRHARDAGDYGRCSALVEAAGGWRLVLFGGMGELRRLLTFIPQAERLSHPRLLLADAYIKLKGGRIEQARAAFDLVSNKVGYEVLDWARLSEFERDALNVGLLIKVYEDNNIDEDLFDEFRRTRIALPDADGLTQGVLNCAGAVAALCLGKLAEAEGYAREAMSSMRSVNSMLGLNYCFLHAGLASLFRGEIRTAKAYLAQSQAMAAENFGSDSGLKAMSDLLLGAVQSWSGAGAGSPDVDLDQSFRHVCEYDGWFDIYAAGLDTRFRTAWTLGDIGTLDAVIADGEALTQARGLRRLACIVEAQRLIRACLSGELLAARGVAFQLEQAFALGCWQIRPACWRPYQDVAFALAMWATPRAPRGALERATDLVASASAVGARLYEIRALLLRACIHRKLSSDAAALTDVARAVRLAAPERIVQPFREQKELTPLIRRLKRTLWQSGGDPLEASFLSEMMVDADRETDANPAGATGLSAREQEVMHELSMGLTNKEIARAMDMTEHTVKFHLKNIFAKLGVDRRAHALAMFKSEAGRRSRQS